MRRTQATLLNSKQLTLNPDLTIVFRELTASGCEMISRDALVVKAEAIPLRNLSQLIPGARHLYCYWGRCFDVEPDALLRKWILIFEAE